MDKKICSKVVGLWKQEPIAAHLLHAATPLHPENIY